MRKSSSEAPARCMGRLLLTASLLLVACAPLSVNEERQLGSQIALQMPLCCQWRRRRRHRAR